MRKILTVGDFVILKPEYVKLMGGYLSDKVHEILNVVNLPISTYHDYSYEELCCHLGKLPQERRHAVAIYEIRELKHELYSRSNPAIKIKNAFDFRVNQCDENGILIDFKYNLIKSNNISIF